MKKIARVLCAAMVLFGTIAVLGFTAQLLVRPAPAYADGPVPCGPSTQPAFPYAGFCANYNGDVTWYGTYGPGFPTDQGFGLCAEPPASGGGFPAPSYNYAPGAQPAGAGGDWNALGFALSEGQANGWWGGVPGQFTADQAAAAAKLLYDTVVWGSPVPSMDPGVLAAYDAFDNWFNEAVGMANAPPQLFVGLTSATTTFTGTATDDIHLQFPGTGRPLVGQGVLLSITNGTFDSPTGPTSIGASTDANGNILVPIYATNASPITVTVTSATSVGQPGLGFYHPTTGELGAQILAAFAAPTTLQASQSLTSNGQPVVDFGTVSIQKSGDDTAYYGLAGALFQVIQSGSVVATLTTNAAGQSPPTAPIPTGTYTVHEVTAPSGYQLAPDQSVTVQAFENTVVSYTGADEEHIIPATVTIAKRDAETGAPLAGAVFDVAYSSANNGVYDQDLGTCTTTAGGTCTPSGNDGASLLPGNYRIQELSAPPGYDLDPSSAVQEVALTPGEAGTATFSDFRLGSLELNKTGDDEAYASVAGALFTVTGPAPSTAPVGTLTVGTDGQSNVLTGLVAGTYTVTETTPPPGYQAIAPLTVAVTDGHATTVLDVVDHVIPATVTLHKVDQETNAPLAGAVFDVRYSSANNGIYDQDLGTCTTTAAGTCAPSGNDGVAALLPGDYQVSEVTPPSGYVLDPANATQDLTLTPGEAGELEFSDPLLVAASFAKVATGNVNAGQVSVAGAVIEVTQGSATGPEVTTCTTDASGRCTSAVVLVSGEHYCWVEVTAPAGLAAGANGCFVATNDQVSVPITVSDAGEFVVIAAKKVDATDHSVVLAGAVFDLYRVDGGHGPGTVPSPPADALAEPGETWVARASTDSTGIATFPLQYPGFSYCIVEHQAPANYTVDPTPHCTGVLSGTTTVPAVVTTLTVPDTEAAVTLSAHKFNALDPNTVIPGATYDLYVQGVAPPSGVASPTPTDAVTEPGDTWYGRGTTDQAGNLSFTVPAGYAWCLIEHSAPMDYLPDPALHCTAVLTTSSPAQALTVALPETLATVHVSATKFNSLQPDTVIPGATYELLEEGPMPPGYSASPATPGVPVPSGDTYWSQGTTDDRGLLSFAVPAGYRWCLHELVAPSGYQTDSAYHCTAVLTTDTTAAAATIALPELPATGKLPFTGGPGLWLGGGGLLLVVGGAGLWLLGRRREDGRQLAPCRDNAG